MIKVDWKGIQLVLLKAALLELSMGMIEVGSKDNLSVVMTAVLLAVLMVAKTAALMVDM